MNDFDIRKFLTENKMTRNSRSLNESIENDILNSKLRVKLNNDGLEWLKSINADSIWMETNTEYYALPKDDPYMDEDDYWIMHPNDVTSVHLPKRFYDIV